MMRMRDLHMTKEYYIDFDSIIIEAENKEEAEQKAKEIVEEEKETIINNYLVNEE